MDSEGRNKDSDLAGQMATHGLREGTTGLRHLKDELGVSRLWHSRIQLRLCHRLALALRTQLFQQEEQKSPASNKPLQALAGATLG